MNNEKYNQIISDAYKNYVDEMMRGRHGGWYEKEEFINKIKTNDEFSKEWGLKIEEREVLEQVDQTNPILKGSTALYPRKLITITYNNETVEIYE